MLKIPRLKNSCRIGLLDEKMAILLAENSERVVEGRLLCAVLGSMGEGRTSDDIADALSDQFGLTEVYYGLAELERLGLLEEANGHVSQEAIFWGLMGCDSQSTVEPMERARVAVASTGGEVSSLVETLRRSGLSGVCETALSDVDLDSRELTVVVAQDYLEEGLSQFNKLAMNHNHPWLLCKPGGIEAWIGPLFIPGETGCWRCLEERLRYNRELEEFIRFKAPDCSSPMFPIGATQASKGFVEGILAAVIGKRQAGEEPDTLNGKILSFNWKTMEFLTHQLARLPRCPECGAETGSEGAHPTPPTLISRKKRYRLDGGHRILTPEKTLEQYSPLVSRITGVVSPLVPTTTNTLRKSKSADFSLLQTYSASHASIGKVRRLEDVKKGIRSGASAGKGLTGIQARTSCLCEAIERVSGIFRGSEHRRQAKYEEVRQIAYHPRDLLQYSERQYRDRKRWNDTHGPFAYVPVPFDESRATDWSPVWSLTQKDWKLMPTAFLYFGYFDDPKSGFCRGDSNGNAAGNCLEEALLQGMMELIERDSVALWWYNMIPRPGVDLDRIQDPMIAQFVDTFDAIGRKVWALDLTSDLGVPVFAAFSSNKSGGADRPIFGLGAHLDPRTAFTRALSEMTQSLAILDFTPEFLAADERLSEHRRFTEETKLEEQPHLLPAAGCPPKDLANYADMSSDDLLDDVNLCVDILNERGLDVLIKDQTRADLGLTVVKVIVPGLRHFWARYAPGRLYDVPVSIGWLSKPTAEEDLNPMPVFF